MKRIFLDAMGGDNAPQSVIDGALEALRANPELAIQLAGPIDTLTPLVKDASDVQDRLTLVDAPDIITNCEPPVMAVRTKKNSAIVKGMIAVKEKEADGFVSCGSTGAVLSGAMFRLGRIEGIERPALAPLMPNGKGLFLLIDCGANVDCKPDWLTQFGIMGDAYMRGVQGMANPRVGLVNNGTEDEKGCALTKAAYQLLKAAPINFVGNVEARDITGDVADVIVADGFVGNVILKFMEGVAGTLMHIIKKELLADTRGKVAGLIAKPAFKRVAKTMDYTEVGGAPLLGVKGAVVKGHGSSNGHAVACAIRQAVKMLDGHVVETIEGQLARINQTQAE